MVEARDTIRFALEALPPALLNRSGAIFYTGQDAFVAPCALYLLGLNPGGDANLQATETIASSIDAFWKRQSPWSAYVDARWAGAKAGCYGIQPRVRHLFKQLNRDLRHTPASNLIFARSRDEFALRTEKQALIEMCWPVHEAVIGALNSRVILCLGQTTGRWVRKKLGAHKRIGCFRENNARKWLSTAHKAENGLVVVTATHPGRANWCNPDTDPSRMIADALESTE